MIPLFDLPQRAELAIGCMTRLVDHELDMQPFFGARFDTKPFRLFHCLWDYGDCLGRHIDALTLARCMTGSTVGIDVEEQLYQLLYSYIGEDGLTWMPKGAVVEETQAEMFSQRSTLLGLVSRYLAYGNERDLSAAQKMVSRLYEIAIHDGPYWFYPGRGFYYPKGWRDHTVPIENGQAAWFGAQIFALLRYYKITGDRKALELSTGLAKFIRERAKDFRPDGGFDRLNDANAHFHSRTATLLGLLKLGLLTDDRGLVNWVRQGYDWVRERWVSSFGWSPENLNNGMRCETCSTTDLIEIGILLAENVSSCYWEVVETFGFNHLLEAQMLHTDWVSVALSEFSPPAGALPADQGEGLSEEEVITKSRKVAEQCMGMFAGWSAPNDLLHFSFPQMMQCCNAAGTRGLYDLWHYTITTRGETVRINLRFDRDHPKVRVRNIFFPDGLIRVDVLQDTRLEIRLPTGIGAEEIYVSGKGCQIKTEVKDGYIQIGKCPASSQVVVRYPFHERTHHEQIGDGVYKLRWRGNIVFEISPPGTVYPLYRRRSYQLPTEISVSTPPLYLPESEIESL